jgi:MFS family permease
MAPWVGRRAQDWGRRPLLLIGFAALPIRALGFALISDPLLLLAVQALDGISATVLGVLTALIIADLTGGTGRFNLAQGIVGTASGTLMVNHGRCSMAAQSHITLLGYFSRIAYSRQKAALYQNAHSASRSADGSLAVCTRILKSPTTV